MHNIGQHNAIEKLLNRMPLDVQYVNKDGFLRYLNKAAATRPANIKREVGINIRNCHAKPESRKYDEKKNVDSNFSGYSPERDNNSTHRIEWEHAVPAEAFGQIFKEWRDGDSACADDRGKSFKERKCAEKKNLEYRRMQADMYNLYPAVGVVNGTRSNYSYD